jgi:hypothetical protein
MAFVFLRYTMLTLYQRLAARSIFIHKFNHLNGVAEVLQLSGYFQRLGGREMSERSQRQADMTISRTRPDRTCQALPHPHQPRL